MTQTYPKTGSGQDSQEASAFLRRILGHGPQTNPRHGPDMTGEPDISKGISDKNQTEPTHVSNILGHSQAPDITKGTFTG